MQKIYCTLSLINNCSLSQITKSYFFVRKTSIFSPQKNKIVTLSPSSFNEFRSIVGRHCGSPQSSIIFASRSFTTHAMNSPHLILVTLSFQWSHSEHGWKSRWKSRSPTSVIANTVHDSRDSSLTNCSATLPCAKLSSQFFLFLTFKSPFFLCIISR